MRSGFLTLLLVGLSTFLSGQVVSTPLALERPQLVLHGTLDSPRQVGDSTLIIIIQGSGPTDRDGNNPMAKNNSLQMLSTALVGKGYFTFRYDKRGIGESILPPENMPNMAFEHFVEDAVAWKEWLEKTYSFNKVFIAGHSQGSLVAGLVHLQSPADGIISLAGTSRPADVLIVDQLGKQNEKLASDAKSYFATLAQGDTLGEINPFLNSLFNPAILPFLKSYIAYNPSEVYQQIKAPVLVVTGAADLQVPVKDGEALDQISEKSELAVIPTMNHVLKSVSSEQENFLSYGNPDLPLHEALVPILDAFLQQ